MRASFLAGVVLLVGLGVVFALSRRALVVRDPVAHTTTGTDAGPSVLRSALEAFGIPVLDYAQLVRDCGNGDDGTSIDDLETVANARGLLAQQTLMPPDELFTDSQTVPAIAVMSIGAVRDFWLIWRIEGDRLRVVDSSVGVRWVSRAEVVSQLYLHEMEMPSATWHEYANGAGHLARLRTRLLNLHVTGAERVLVDARRSDEGLQRLDAALRAASRADDSNAVFGRYWAGAAAIPGDAFEARSTSKGTVRVRGALTLILQKR